MEKKSMVGRVWKKRKKTEKEGSRKPRLLLKRRVNEKKRLEKGSQGNERKNATRKRMNCCASRQTVLQGKIRAESPKEELSGGRLRERQTEPSGMEELKIMTRKKIEKKGAKEGKYKEKKPNKKKTIEKSRSQ